MRKLSVILMLLVLMPCFPDAAIAQTVWHLNADSCRMRALESNVAVKNADLNIEAAVETKRSAVAKYFPSVSANVSAFMLHDYLIDISSSDVKDGDISMGIYSEGRPIEDYINESLEGEWRHRSLPCSPCIREAGL